MSSAWGLSFGKAFGNAWGRIAEQAAINGGAYSLHHRYAHHPWMRPVFDYAIPDRTVRAIVKTAESVIEQRTVRDVDAEKKLIEEKIKLIDLAESREYLAALRLLIAFEYQRIEQEQEDAMIAWMLFEM